MKYETVNNMSASEKKLLPGMDGVKHKNCPKCIGKLSPMIVHEVEIDRCFVCEGLWFDSGELEKVLKKNLRKSDRLGFDSTKFEGIYVLDAVKLNSKEGFCPICTNEKMLKSVEEQSGITIDYCRKGYGIWLDGGEIMLMRHNSRGIIGSVSDLVKYLISLSGLRKYF